MFESRNTLALASALTIALASPVGAAQPKKTEKQLACETGIECSVTRENLQGEIASNVEGMVRRIAVLKKDPTNGDRRRIHRDKIKAAGIIQLCEKDTKERIVDCIDKEFPAPKDGPSNPQSLIGGTAGISAKDYAFNSEPEGPSFDCQRDVKDLKALLAELDHIKQMIGGVVTNKVPKRDLEKAFKKGCDADGAILYYRKMGLE